ncbi:tripartite tricarboxylate transporter substrate binding protein (plasmid) [Cupriavidus pinatubonensis]|uniref:Bug family tripartite tricarboxylate transporter substrate binding protein n=1 Tax=Cupriavidus pinatubonensis TaxID=248026 RepID=UPI001C7349DB|nr:tripartite tricarboxylate transporter substrate binding protein [Cupriavidus pinatubonensis]QYY33824.1 tripartite tricarboxylate transporter substrate binding protein [Cupriavidus pinatubonensis]
MRTKIQRQHFLLSCVLGLASTLAHAGGYPDRPIRLVVGFPPGGGADYVARVVGQHLGETLGVSVVVENKPGANGTIAAGDVARMPADGYTLLLGVPASQSISPVLMSKLPYDPLRDFTPISNVGFTPLVLVVNAKTPAKSVGEFVKYVAASREPVAYGSAGTGNITHMAGELFTQSTGLKNLRHIPYKGSSQVITDLIGGHVTAYFDTLPSSLPFIQSGQLRALGVTSGARTSIAPDIPTLKESGVAGYMVTTWFGILAPPKLSPQVVDRIYQALRKGLDTPEVRKTFASRGIELMLDTPPHFQATLSADIAQWREVTKKGGITAN